MLTNPNVSDRDLRDTMNLAKARVYHYQSIGWTCFSKAELLSAAYEGIAEAIIRFEPAKGTVKDTKFSSYAYFWIEKYLKEFITKNKTMLSGTNFELWTGQVPYTNSIDAYDDSANDSVGSDHKDWLGAGVEASGLVESMQYSKALQDLLAKIFLELEPIERLVIQLSLGIGTVNKEPLSHRQIAKSCNLTKMTVEQILSNAMQKLQAVKEQYIVEFNEL